MVVAQGGGVNPGLRMPWEAPRSSVDAPLPFVPHPASRVFEQFSHQLERNPDVRRGRVVGPLTDHRHLDPQLLETRLDRTQSRDDGLRPVEVLPLLLRLVHRAASMSPTGSQTCIGHASYDTWGKPRFPPRIPFLLEAGS